MLCFILFTLGYDDNAHPIVSSTPYPSTLAITQHGAVLPHNYHAQLATGHYDDDQSYDYSTEASDDHLYKRNSNKKRQSIQNREDQVKKFESLANRMKLRMRSAKATTTKSKPQKVHE